MLENGDVAALVGGCYGFRIFLDAVGGNKRVWARYNVEEWNYMFLANWM